MTIDYKPNNSTFSSAPHKLIIAEKPSVGVEIAKILGAKTRKDGYFEGGGYYVSWCVGHLISLELPEAYDEKYKSRSIELLPIFPDQWKYKISETTEKQYRTLESLINKKDVTELVCATDAGREGEHIFRLVYQMAGATKPFKRLWISSLEPVAIKDGFDNLLDGHSKDAMAAAAMCRAQADWLVGMNMSRLFSTPIGRVQTPTLALVVNRENAIKNFTESFQYRVTLSNGGIKLNSAKMELEADANILLGKVVSQPATITQKDEKEANANPSKLYDLTTLQREASRMFGFTAKDTLKVLQHLYENKLVTYPRTDSSFLTDDMRDSTLELITALLEHEKFNGYKAESVNIDRVIDGSKVSDHHAVLPTKLALSKNLSELSQDEQKIFSMVTAKLLIATAPPEVSKNTKLEAQCAGETFKCSSKTIISEGFRALEKLFKSSFKIKEETEKEIEEESGQLLDSFNIGQVLSGLESGIDKIKLSPPAHFTEDTLLAAMERAGNEDYEDEGTEKKGIGTPATMADIIDGLVNKNKFLERKGKQMLPTERGSNLIQLLPDTLISPKMTAQWETGLQQIEKGSGKADVFMKEIEDFVCLHIAEFDELTPEQKALIPKNPAFEKQTLCDCPRCGSPVYVSRKNYYCSSRDCGLFLMLQPAFFVKAKKTLTESMAKNLLTKGKIAVKGLYSEKKDKTYDATIVLDDPGEGFLNFKLEFDTKKK